MSNKEAYYFSHDSNARNDEKLLAVRMKLGAEGYGIYFMILERLRDESTNMSIKDYNILAFDFRVSADKVKSVIENFGLFEFTDDKKFFFSKRMLNNMKVKNEKSIKARESAESRWKNSDRNANALQSHSEGNAIKGKESKVNKSKEEEEEKEEKALPPNFKKLTIQQFHEELKSYVSEFSKPTVSAFFNFWTEKDSNGKMKFQRQETWETKKRLIMWKNKEAKWNS